MPTSDLDAQLDQQLAPGHVFEEKYEILSELGTGSFARVVKARHTVMGREVALKCLKPSVVHSNPEVADRFVHEVQIVSRLRHPNTVTIFDFGQTDDDLAFMVLEYVDGVPLDEVIAQQGALGEDRAAHICRQVLHSLAEAHDQGIIHRDLKPSNIMLTELHGERDFVKVLDFGVAKLIEEAEEGDQRFEPRSTRFIGTPVYMSPEQVLGKSVSPASDLYSLALVLYEMLTGEPPIVDDNVASVVREHLEEGPLDFDQLDRLSTPYRKLIRRATQRESAARFQGVSQFERALPGEGAAAPALDEPSETDVQDAGRGLDEESDDFDVFSGKDYIAPPEPSEAEVDLEDVDASSLRDARPTPQHNRADVRAEDPPRKPSPSSGELDLDLDTVERQRRRVERRRRAASSSPVARSRNVDGDWEAREYLRRIPIYAVGVISAYWGFVLAAAMLYQQRDGTRMMAGVLIVAAAVAWTAFSDTKAVGVDVGRRWFLPTSRHFAYILCLLLVLGALWQPDEVAIGLSKQPAWFLEGLPAVPPVTWLEAITQWGAARLAGLFEMIAGFLPYR
ncbi:MAG: serine/threonine-protein kinase [Persicimonas sp.]